MARTGGQTGVTGRFSPIDAGGGYPPLDRRPLLVRA